MPFVYVQKTGSLYRPNRKLLAVGYSGHGQGLNNPAWQDHVGVGPIPCGRYTIGAVRDPPDHLGPVAMPLEPHSDNNMHGRSAFWIHGDNASLNHSASDGCLILARGFRQQIADSYVRDLTVVAQEQDVSDAEE